MKKIIFVIILIIIIVFIFKFLYPKNIIEERIIYKYDNSILQNEIDTLEQENVALGKEIDKKINMINKLQKDISKYEIQYKGLENNYIIKVEESELRSLGLQEVNQYNCVYKTTDVINGIFGSKTKWSFYGEYETLILFDYSKLKVQENVIIFSQDAIIIKTPMLLNKNSCFKVDDGFLARDFKWEESMITQINAEEKVLQDLFENYMISIINNIQASLQSRYPDKEIRFS